ncbi:hypothetical protein VHEMI02154 [[Torrubiella] hemipterigena]|uniref:Uncharacterized protein n=1 Tax=[Torrubiella] hemipterigena TaxID=1531966 RepID=A0A0A1SNT1_9HYPO|nr:hypothetical protein VHEMI02154 [[Torrubiella] hemipterigena]
MRFTTALFTLASFASVQAAAIPVNDLSTRADDAALEKRHFYFPGRDEISPEKRHFYFPGRDETSPEKRHFYFPGRDEVAE